jgi:peptidyl-prolyl cis-trans isomerase D
MLEQMRKSSQSLLIYVLFGIVIAVFIINFGPQSRSGGGSGCDGAMGGDESAAHVAGESISAQAFRSAFMLLGGGSAPPQMQKLRRFKESVMDRLIERELFAQEAERLGYSVSEDDVHKMLLDGQIIGFGMKHTIPRIQRDGVFDYDQFKKFTQFELGLTPDRFVEEQQREMLAAQMRNLLRASVKLSPEEVKSAFEFKSRQINLEYLRFPSRKFESEVEPTADEIATYVKANEAKLKDTFTQRKQMFTDVPQEIRVREILVKPTKAAGDEKANAAADEAAATAARKRADGLRARIAKGEAFAKVAREASEDPDSKGRGGDLGWRRKGTMGLEDDGETKLFAAKAGDVIGPIKSSQGFVLLTASGTRQGTLTFDAVKGELAEEQIRQAKAVTLAKQKAEAALTTAKAAPEKSLKDLFPGADAAATTADATKPAKPNAKIAAPVVSDARAEETGLFARRGTVVEQIGDSPELAKAAWGLTAAAPFAGPVDVAGSYVVVRLKERKDPDPSEWEKKKVELRRDAELTKWNQVMTDWAKHRCLEAKAAGRITVNKSILKYEDSQEPTSYDACVGELPARHSS